jgi:predicted ATPase/DNA-binding SARP family transcriptional activator
MPQLALWLFGGLQVRRDGRPVTHFRSDKAQALLAFLAVESARAHRRDALAEMLWGEMPTADALRNLRQTFMRLRRALDDADDSSFFQITPQSLQFPITPRVVLDVAEFQKLLDEISSPLDDASVERVTRAVELYRGDFLAGFFVADSPSFDEWVARQRERLHQQCLDALAVLSAHLETRGEYARAAQFARRQVELEPWREAAHRQLMRALALDGQRTAALAQYETCKQLLDVELGLAPEVETEALAERIRDGELTRRALTAPAPTHNLPPTLTSFVGRETELAQVGARLANSETRLLTLVGPGGIGKTRLALAAATNALQHFSDGVYFAELAAVEQASALAPTLANTLGLRLSGAREPLAQLLDFLRAKELLLVLDNLEQLLDATTRELLARLIQAAPRAKILVTSREVVGLRAEQVYVVSGMDVAVSDSHTAVAESDAARLFLRAAQRRQADLTLNENNLNAVQRICRATQGMPLALELAAAWSNVLDLNEIADEIEASADFLATDAPDVPARQRSIRAVFDSAWKMLNESERAVFRKLAYFRGGATREAAVHIAGASSALLMALVGKSHLRLERGGAGGRYQMHELMRQYGHARLQESSAEFFETYTKHGRYFLEWFNTRAPRLRGLEIRTALAEILRELPNMRLAWKWAVAEFALDEVEPNIVGWSRFCHFTGLLAEGEELFIALQARLEQELAASPPRADLVRLRAVLCDVLIQRAGLTHHRGNFAACIALAQRAVELADQVDRVEFAAYAQMFWGHALWRLTRYAEAQEHYRRMLDLARADAPHRRFTRRRHAEIMALRGLGLMQMYAGNLDAARELVDEAFALSRELDDERATAVALDGLSSVAIAQNDLDTAQRSLEQELALSREANDPWPLQSATAKLGTVYHQRGDYENARRYLEQGEQLALDLGARWLIPQSAFELAQIAARLGEFETARGHFARGWQFVQELDSKPMHAQASTCRALLYYLEAEYANALEDGTRALALANESGEPYSWRDALVILGKTRARLGQNALARELFQEALTLTRVLGLIHLVAEIESELARVELAEKNFDAARRHVDSALQRLEMFSIFSCVEPFGVYANCYAVLRALNDSRARETLETAQRVLETSAAKLSDQKLREWYLRRNRV